MAQDKLWTRSFIIMTAINFVGALAFYLLSVEMVEFSCLTYGVSESLGGGTITSYVIGALLTRLLLGGRIDEWGVRASLRLGLAINVVMCFLYMIPWGFAPLLIVRFIHGVGFAFTSGSMASIAVMLLPASRRGEGIGYFSMAQALATGIGPFIAIIVMSSIGDFNILFLITGTACLLAFIALYLVKLPPAADGTRKLAKAAAAAHGCACDKDSKVGSTSASMGSAGTRASMGSGAAVNTANLDGRITPRSTDCNKPRFSIDSLIQVNILPLGATLFLAYLCYAGAFSFMTMYSKECGLGSLSSMFFMVYSIVILLSRPVTGRYVDRKSPNPIIYLSIILLMGGMLLLWLTKGASTQLGVAAGSIALIAAAALTGFGLGNTQSVIQAIIPKVVSETELGKANSTFFMSMDLGCGIGPMFIGAFIPFVGYAWTFFGLAFVAVAALIVYLITFVRPRQQTSSTTR